MQTARRTSTYDYHSPHNKPQFTVQPGEIFVAETELCTGGWLTSPEDVWTPDKTSALNPAVVVAVAGAKPGDVLKVTILDIVPDKQGYTGFSRASNPLARIIADHPWDMNVRTVRIEDGYVLFNQNLRLPIAPMIGTLGTAPAVEVISNAFGGRYGGNMDVQEVAPGATVYLPVAVEGALLHIGDVHAIQGDGEICCSGGIECRSVVTLKAEVLPAIPGMATVRIETDAYIGAIACLRSMEESFYAATRELLGWMAADYGFSFEEGYLLMAQVLEARNTQMVNPTRSTIAKMPKRFLKRG